jgi:predicted transcriptional regulator
MYSQIDTEGNRYLLLSEIIDHLKDKRAMDKDVGIYVDKRGRSKPRITTKGWKFLVEWKDGTTSWVPLKDIKESFPN